MWNYIKLAVLGIAVVLFGLAANYGRDFGYQIHALIFMAAAAITFIYTLRMTGDVKAQPEGYFDGVVRYGVIATAGWGVVGFLVGTFIAFQLAFPSLNFEFLQGHGNFGRLRPLHTSAVIFAFGGNALIASSFYVVQRTSAARLFGGGLGWFVFWGYNLFIVLAATGYVLGVTQSKEYAEPEWYIDLWLTIVWVAYLVAFMGTIFKRKEKHIYVANWFYLSFIVTIAMLHIVNNLLIPVSFLDTVVVRSQRCGLLPHRRLPWHDVLLCAETSRASGVLLQTVDHSLLGFDLPLHLGWPAPSALHRFAGLGFDPRYGVLHRAVDAVLGWYDQRSDDAVWRMGQVAH